jgi:CheY-like chemotaxis protein
VNRTVLIADGDVNAQIIAETLLRLRGVDVRLAADGTEACQRIRSEDIAVMVLELSLPGMNGFEVMRRLRGRFGPSPTAQSPRIIAVTDRKEPEVERFVRHLGADAFLRKPLIPSQLIGTVEGLLAIAVPQSAA